MVRPPGRAAPSPPPTQPPQTKTPDAAVAWGSLRGCLSGPHSTGSCSSAGRRGGPTPISTPRALQDPQPSANAPLAAASHFLGPKSILQRVKRSPARSRLPPTPHPPPLWTKRGLRPGGGDDLPPPPPSEGHFVILFLTLLSPSFKQDDKKKRLKGERGQGAK